jgi:hypothetical protein
MRRFPRDDGRVHAQAVLGTVLVRGPVMCCHRLVPATPTDGRTTVAPLSPAVAETTAAQTKIRLMKSSPFTKNADSFGVVRTAGV